MKPETIRSKLEMKLIANRIKTFQIPRANSYNPNDFLVLDLETFVQAATEKNVYVKEITNSKEANGTNAIYIELFCQSEKIKCSLHGYFKSKEIERMFE